MNELTGLLENMFNSLFDSLNLSISIDGGILMLSLILGVLLYFTVKA